MSFEERADAIPKDLHADAEQNEGRQTKDYAHAGFSKGLLQLGAQRGQSMQYAIFLSDIFPIPSFGVKRAAQSTTAGRRPWIALCGLSFRVCSITSRCVEMKSAKQIFVDDRDCEAMLEKLVARPNQGWSEVFGRREAAAFAPPRPRL